MHQPPAIVRIAVEYPLFDRVRVIAAKLKLKQRFPDKELPPEQRDIGQSGLEQDRRDRELFWPINDGELRHNYGTQDRQHSVEHVSVAYGLLEGKQKGDDKDAENAGNERNKVGGVLCKRMDP